MYFQRIILVLKQDINDTTTKAYVYIQLIGIGQFCYELFDIEAENNAK